MSFHHFRALIKKNILILKRTYILTFFELFSPMIVMLVLLLTNSKFETKHEPIYINDEYIIQNCSFINNNYGLGKAGNCKYNKYSLINKCYDSFIALIGKDFPKEIENEIQNIFYEIRDDKASFRYYDDILELNDYIKSKNYKKMTKVCFGISYEKNDDLQKYIFKLHFIASKYTNFNKFISKIPSSDIDNLDPFRISPDFDSYYLYKYSGFLVIQKILYDYILKTETGNSNAEIIYTIVPAKYEERTYNLLHQFMEQIISIFFLIAYAFPMCINIYRLIKEKESKAKEIMKIMGLDEFNYYFSYFVIYSIFNLLHAIGNALIVKQILNYIELGYLFVLFFLYGLVIFSLVFFFQSFLEKANISIIFCLLVYSIMYFIGFPLNSSAVKKSVKIVFALLFPPINISFGSNTITQFQINFNKFKGRTLMNFKNYSVCDMYIVFIFNFILYMFIGFYLQNVLQHQFGLSKPWNFLCTKNFWGCDEKNNENKKKLKNVSIMLSNMYEINANKINSKNKKKNYDEKDDDFAKSSRDEINNDIKSNQTNPDNIDFGNNDIETLKIKNIKKYFGEKLVLSDVNFELKKNEIFVLLGHNGAGKTTLISILTGLIRCTSGSAMINNCNVLSPESFEHFRQMIGVCPQHDVLFNDLTVEEHLELFYDFKTYDRKDTKEEINNILKDIGLEDKRTTRASDLSGGQKRKLSIGLAIVGKSSIIFLDEPTSGMDITSRRNLWDILKKIVSNKIVILTTHFMEEAQILGDKIGILSKGEMQVVGTPLELIDKYTNCVNLNITKHSDADENMIISEILPKFGELDVYFENFYRDIYFRIPTDHPSIKIEWNEFFKFLDKNLEKLKIKSYSISKSTLEDVFINFSQIMNKEKKDNIKVNYDSNKNKDLKNSRILFNEENYDENNSDCEKFLKDFKISFMKRLKQITREKKTLILEIICPILLSFIGCLVGYIEFLEENRAFPFHLNQITNDTQIIYYNDRNAPSSIFEYMRNHGTSEDISNIKFEYVNFPNYIIDSNRYLSNKVIELYNSKGQNNVKSYVYYDMFENSPSQHQYGFNLIIDIKSRQAAPIYANFLLNEVVHFATKNDNLKIEMINEPLSFTYEEKKNKKNRNQFMILFFISLAFSLIPSNFITVIIKERENNSKHLQIISGISLFGYWFNNYIFELVKYYFIGGICLLLLLAFDFYEKYFVILYLEYGPAMISFTYVFSVIIKSEYMGQISVLLINIIFGTIFGIAVIIMRLYDQLIDYANDLSYFLRIFPSFCFCYGYNQLLNREKLFNLDKGISIEDDDMIFSQEEIDKNILLMKHIGTDCIYLAVESIFYLLILIILENTLNINICKHRVDLNHPEFRDKPNYNLQASRMVLEEREDNKNYSIKVKNLVKIYYKLCGKDNKAVRNISFNLEEGEIFGFLGTNGAGKTTTFKCLSNEIIPSMGSIRIKNYDIAKDFNKVRNLIGYCPQFDTIFEYLTVYENLEFYGLVKGAKKSNLDEIINALIEEMNLENFRDKISGTLSGGNKRKLSVAIALICNPPIILLDEPSTGMDPEARRHMWKAIYNVSINKKKSTIIMTTHSMEEAESLCKKIGILVNGKFECYGTSDEIKDSLGYGFEIKLQIKNPNIDQLCQKFEIDPIDKDEEISFDSFDEDIAKFNLQNYKNQMFFPPGDEANPENNTKFFGDKLYNELKNNGKIVLRKILLWIYYSTSVLNFVKFIKGFFEKITCVDYKDNNFVFSIKRNKRKTEKTIGFLFGQIEERVKDKNKNKFNIAQYNLQYSTLEQIFNSLANPNKNKEDDQIEIDEELLNRFCN